MSKFKTDDRVRCILSERGDDWNYDGDMDYILKGVHTVTKPLCGDNRFGIEGWSLRDYEFELANKFKVGDQIIGNSTNQHSITNKTNISTVVAIIDENRIKVTVHSGSSEYSVASSKFDLYVPVNMIEHKFAIRDIVTNRYGNKRIISKVVISYATECGIKYDEEDLKLVVEPEVIEVTMADLEAKYGTKVKVIK